ncbi:hypothetical protein [Geodermatophilus sp. URMC 64]
MPGQPYPPMQSGQPAFPPPQPPQKKSGWKNPWVWVALLAIVVIGGTLAGRGKDSTDTNTAAAPTTASTTTAEPPASVAPQPLAPTQATTPPPAAPTSAGVDFPMPDVVGMDLQSAQDLIQTFGVFFSVSHDLRGSRLQAIDSNWIVCTQNIPAGQQVTGDAEGKIDLGVVKRDETCP